jgi:hypothetical protein
MKEAKVQSNVWVSMALKNYSVVSAGVTRAARLAVIRMAPMQGKIGVWRVCSAGLRRASAKRVYAR